MKIITYHSRAHDLIGLIPTFIDESDPRPTREQLNENYAHGGGWRPMKGWKMCLPDHAIYYPGDPELLPVAKIEFREDALFIYPHAWVMLVAADGTHEIARMD